MLSQNPRKDRLSKENGTLKVIRFESVVVKQDGGRKRQEIIHQIENPSRPSLQLRR